MVDHGACPIDHINSFNENSHSSVVSPILHRNGIILKSQCASSVIEFLEYGDINYWHFCFFRSFLTN
jgi:hypothetical protein